jgi:hypothetical protein
LEELLAHANRAEDERSDPRHRIAGANRFPVESVRALAVDDHGHVVILVDDHHRHEALARIGQRDRHRPCI